MNHRMRRSLIGGGIVLLLIMFAVIAFYATGFATLLGFIPRRSFDHAEYGNMTFSGKGNEFYAFSIDSYHSDNVVPSVYVKGVTDKMWYLPELAESDVAAVANEQLSGRDLKGRQTTRYHFGKTGYCRFSDGKLTEFGIDRHDAFRIGASSRGEFVGFPIDKRTMIRVFGTPKQYRKSYQRPV